MDKAGVNHVVPSVLAAAGAVELLAAAPRGMRQAAIASRLGISTSTCYRILRSLAVRGWVRKGGAGSWSLGHGLLPVAMALGRDADALVRAREVLSRLSLQHGISCKLSLRRGFEQYVAARAEPPSQIQATGSEGISFPLVEGSSGAALLADASDEEALALCRAAPSNVQTDSEFMLACLRELRQRGWCVRKRILDWPVAALSAPVRDERGAVYAAISFVVPEKRLSDPTLPPLLLAAAAQCGASQDAATAAMPNKQ